MHNQLFSSALMFDYQPRFLFKHILPIFIYSLCTKSLKLCYQLNCLHHYLTSGRQNAYKKVNGYKKNEILHNFKKLQ